MGGQMSNCPWEAIDGFHSINKFKRFEAWLADQVHAEIAIEIPVSMPYFGITGLSEKWFKHLESNSVWRLVRPDGPFTGLFELIM
jgi:hypothetical protein